MGGMLIAMKSDHSAKTVHSANAGDSHEQSLSGVLGMSGIRRRRFLGQLAGGGGALLAPGLLGLARAGETAGGARGLVFHDRDGSGRPNGGNPGVPGVAVSNGRDVVLTDGNGRWDLPVLDDSPSTDFFVIPGRGWTTPMNADWTRRAHYTYHPQGSPDLHHAGFPASGPMPESVDFALREEDQPDRFSVLVCGDPQPRDLREVDYLARTVPPDLSREEAAFAVTLGDILFDDLAIFPQLRGALAASGLPWHYVIGNHDLNFDSKNHALSRETYRHQVGPTTYSFDHGPVHFIVVDNVEWMGANPDNPLSTGNYRGYVQERDLQFIANDLAHVPKDRLVVVFMHIPLYNPLSQGDRALTLNREKLCALLADRPHTLSFSAHTHWHLHTTVGAEEGWPGEGRHHHVISGTLCGSWFRGSPDFNQVPIAVMGDGTPRGYQRVEFEGNRYTIDGYKTLGGDKRSQMHLYIADEVSASAAAETPFHANVYAAGEKARVRARIGGGDTWREMKRTSEPDPLFTSLAIRDADLELPWRPLPRPMDCPHLWRATLPEGLEPGSHTLEVEAEDGFGHVWRESRAFRVV